MDTNFKTSIRRKTIMEEGEVKWQEKEVKANQLEKI